jgi:hypothetical protein
VRFLGVVGAGVREEGQFELLGKLKRERSSSVKRATKELSQFVMVHGEIWVVSLPILPTTGGVGRCPTCFGTATKRREVVGSTNRRPAVMSWSN